MLIIGGETADKEGIAEQSILMRRARAETPRHRVAPRSLALHRGPVVELRARRRQHRRSRSLLRAPRAGQLFYDFVGSGNDVGASAEVDQGYALGRPAYPDLTSRSRQSDLWQVDFVEVQVKGQGT